MESSIEKAHKAKAIVEKQFTERDFMAAKNYALKAQKLCPELEEWMILLSTKKGTANFGRGLIVHWINTSTSWFACCTQYLFMDLWISWLKVTCQKPEYFLIAFEETMR